MGLDGWRPLRAGSGGGTVLCVDFTLAKVRAQANFGDLAPGLPGGYAVWGTEEAAWPTSAGEPHKQLGQWLDGSRAVGDLGSRRGQLSGDLGSRSGESSGAPVHAVLGFCGAASLAAALAGNLAAFGGAAPQLILFNPVTVNGQTMIDQFDTSLRRVAGAADEPAPGDDPPACDDLDQLATLLAERYAAVAGAACAAQGVPASIADQLCQRVETNLRYLALCATAKLDAAQPTLLVLSSDHAATPPQVRGAPQVRVDTDQDGLLSHPEAARAVASALAGDLAAGRP